MSRGIMILLVAVILILAVVLALVLLRYKKMEKFADRAMIQANDIMEQLILGREVKYFSENEDSLLGKFQARAGRLYDIHSAQEQREKELRDHLPEAETAAGTSGGFICCRSGIVKGRTARKRYLSGRAAGSESLFG